MDLVTHSVLIISAVCLTLGLINLRFWISRRRSEFLAVGLAGVSVAVYSWFEVAMAGTDSVEFYRSLMRWGQIPIFVVFVSIASFLYVHMEAKRRWMLRLFIGTRLLGASISFLFPVSIHFREITALGHVTVLGETLAYPIGVPNPWVLIHYLSFIILMIFTVDTTAEVWRRGMRRKALVFGAGFVLFTVAAFAIGAMVVWGEGRVPVITSPAILFVIIAFSFELNYDLRRSVRLARKLASTEAIIQDDAESLRLSASAANLGLWKRNLADDTVAATDEWYRLLGYEPGTKLTFHDYLEMIHPDDRERVEAALRAVTEGGEEYATEYQITLANGETRWISSIGKAEIVNGVPRFLRGVSVDITKRKLAEQAAHELSGKLISAQEKERARLARELHDDLSQSLALLSIQLQTLGTKPSDSGAIRKHVDQLTEQIQRLSTDVHRISHELHPSKLSQLGLEAALRGFCREAGSARGIKTRFESQNFPRVLPNDISLCLYRIAQEALQNAGKHSDASLVNVSLSVEDGVIKLVVADNGCGFDPDTVRTNGSLGLISMDERIRAVDGKLTIQSVPDAGTKIEARVPLPSHHVPR